MKYGVYPGLESMTSDKEAQDLAFSGPSAPPTMDEEQWPVTGSWQRDKGVLECNRQMLEKQLACDVWFSVGPSHEQVGAHRYVLRSRSGVFFAMFDRPVSELTKIDLPEVDPVVFWQLLRYLYFEELYPSQDTVLDLLALAEKYDVLTVCKICLQFLHSCLSIKTACAILEVAHQHDDHNLEKETLQFIRKYGVDVLQTESMDKLCRECLNKVLTLDGLEMGPALQREVTDRWARRQCENKRQEPTEDNKLDSLGDVLYVKRNNRSSHRFVLDSITDRNLAEDDPQPRYSELMNGGLEEMDNVSVSSVPSVGTLRSMKSQISQFSWPDLNHVTRFHEMDGEVSNDGTVDAISFTVDRDIYLHGFGIYGNKSNAETKYRVETVITRKKKDIVMEIISIKGVGVILPVMFEKPVRIERSRMYTLEIYVHGKPSRCGSDGQCDVTDGIVKFKFSKATAIKGNRTDDKRGQIPRLYFLPC